MNALRALVLTSFALLAIAGEPQTVEAASATQINADANATLQSFVAQNPSARELGRKAAGVLVFPSVIKAGLGLCGEYGEGVLIVRAEPAGYYNIISASFGFQLGVQSRSVIIMFMTQEALAGFQNAYGWKVGVDGSVVVVTVVQALLLGAVQAAWGRWDPILASCLVFAPPVNLLVFGLDNLLFLWFPSKVVAANPGDFQALGRNVLVLLTKVGVLLVAGGVAAGLGGLIWLLTRSLPGTLATAWFTLSLFAMALVPVIALAFRGFDVSRDMPA